MSQELPPKYFSNSKEELEFYKNTYKLKVDELISCQTKIKHLENINNKLKEQIINNFSKNIENNESSKFLFTPNEFKNLWESVIQTELIDSFDFCIKEYKLISNLSQDIMLLVYDETKKIIEMKFCEILKCLNLSKTTKNKKDNLYEKILPFFRENFHNAFEFNEERIKNIKQKLDSVLKQYNFLNEINIFKNNSSKVLNNVNIEVNDNSDNGENSNLKNIESIKILENKIKGKNFDSIIKNFFTICLYMLLHEPPLNFNIEKYSQRKLIYYFYNKKDYINVEGFGYDKSPCVLILQPPLLKNKYQFNGLKPAVYILSDSCINKDILNQCEINEKNKEEENKKENKDIYNNSNNNIGKIVYNNNDKKIKIKNKIEKNNINKFNENNNNEILNKNNNKINYDKNLNYNNFFKNNTDKILNKSFKINNDNITFGNIEEIYNNHKIQNKINIKDNINKNSKKNNIINNNKGYKVENNNNNNNNLNNNIINNQNLSYNHIQNNNKMNYLKNSNNIINNNIINDNYYIHNIKNNFQLYNENNNTDRRIKKEKIFLEKYKYEKEFDFIDNNPMFNYSQKIPNDKNNILYHNNTFETLLKQNINNKINNHKQEFKQNRINNNINDNNLRHINKTNNNSKNKKKNQKIEKIGEERFKRNNTVGIPSSEKINAKYYSSFNKILNDKNEILRQLTNINDNNNSNNFITLKKINMNRIKQEYDNNFNTKKNNYYSYDEYYNDNNDNNIIEDNIKFKDRKIKLNINYNYKYNNIIDNKNIIYSKKRGIETSIQKNKYNNQYNIKDNNIIKKNNLSPLFNAINEKNRNEEKIKNNNSFVENKQLIHNQNINYINSFNNINNYNKIDNINNINNINYYNNIYNNNINNLIKLNYEYPNNNKKSKRNSIIF